jgi:hypothetical protein
MRTLLLVTKYGPNFTFCVPNRTSFILLLPVHWRIGLPVPVFVNVCCHRHTRFPLTATLLSAIGLPELTRAKYRVATTRNAPSMCLSVSLAGAEEPWAVEWLRGLEAQLGELAAGGGAECLVSGRRDWGPMKLSVTAIGPQAIRF